MESLLFEAIHEALRADQDPTDAMRLFGDWLQSQGDPHGELVALGCALADTGDDDVAAMHLLRTFRQSCRTLRPTLFGHALDEASGFQSALPCGFLRWLEVDITQVSPEQLNSVLSRPASAFLREVDLRNRAKREQPILLSPYFDALQPCEHIRTLSVTGRRLEKPDVLRIAALTNLRSLDLSRSSLSSDLSGHDWLPRLKSLESLTLKLCPPVDLHGHLTALPALERLNIEFTQLDAAESSVLDEDATIESLSAHRRLVLRLSHVDWPEVSYRRLASITSLRELSLASLDFNRDIARALEPAQKLEELRISFSESACDLASLPLLTGLRRLHVSHNDELTGARLAYLDRVPDLEELQISRCESFDRQAIIRVANLRNLHTLELSNCRGLQPGDLSVLSELSELRDLDLSTLPGVSSHDLTMIISKQSHLREFTLWDLPCEEALFDALASCHGLRSLCLGYCTIDESWLLKLTALPMLTSLSLPRTPTSDTLARLQDAMPACDICAHDFESDSLIA